MVHLSNHELAGLVEVPDDESERLMINLDFMRYQSEQVDDDSWADPLAGVTAEDFVPLRFAIACSPALLCVPLRLFSVLL